MEEELQVFIDAAEQLEGIKKALSEQQSYATRLRDVTESIERAAANIAKVPGALNIIFKSAQAVEQRIVAVAVSVEALKNEIPAVIERIEQSDVGQSIDSLLADISDSRSDLKDFRKSILEVDNIFGNFRIENENIFKGISAELDLIKVGQKNMNSAVELLRSDFLKKLAVIDVRISNSATIYENGSAVIAREFEDIASALKGSNESQIGYFKGLKTDIEALRNQEMSIILQEMKAISNHIQQQGKSIEALAKKKGFLF